MTAPKKKPPAAIRPVKDGRAARAERVVTAKTVFEVKIRGEAVARLAVGNVPLSEIYQVRRQVMMNWLDVKGEVGVGGDVYTMSVLVWLARRASGEPGLTWQEFQDGWDNTIREENIRFVPVFDDPAEDADPQP